MTTGMGKAKVSGQAAQAVKAAAGGQQHQSQTAQYKACVCALAAAPYLWYLTLLQLLKKTMTFLLRFFFRKVNSSSSRLSAGTTT